MLKYIIFILVQLNISLFLCNAVKFYLLEEQPINTTVGTTNITGFSYRLDDQDVNGFWLDSKTGTIYTRKVFDRESLTVNEINNGFKFNVLLGKKTVWEINVFIIDINDHVPYFKVPVYDLSVSEDVDLNTNLPFPSAIDLDAGNNAKTTYGIVSGDIFNNFRVNTPSSFEKHDPYLTVVSLLDLEYQADSIILNISSCDSQSMLCSYGIINVTVLDVNDHKPVFAKNIYFAHVDENVPVGTSVTKVTATDADRGKNAKVYYKVGKNVDKFSIHPDTGDLRVHGRLDAEDINLYNVLVVALDYGDPQLSSTTVVKVYVKDTNDNAPEVKVVYSRKGRYNVLEGEEIGTVVATLEVRDKDINIDNRKVKLKLSKTLEYFLLHQEKLSLKKEDPDIYTLCVNKIIDRELTPQFIVKIKAVDSGSPRLRTNVDVKVLVGDVNDNAPQFSKLYYSKSISESAPIGFSIMNLTATDADLENNRKITYNIVSDTSNGCVQISSLGSLYLAKTIDREDISQVCVNVTATDGGHPPLQNFTFINITILDINDNDPYFYPSSFNFNLTENNKPNEYIGKVTAFDKDIVGSSLLTYHLNSTKFRIDSDTGKIYATKPLNREEQALHMLTVYVVDGGNHRGCGKVYVKVIDVNDNSPKFEQSFYNLSIHENFPVGHIAVYVTATDLDEGENAKINYSANFQDDTFSIDSYSGGIILNKNLKKQTKTVFSFQINAQDNLRQQVINTVDVELHILPASNLLPVFTKKLYKYNVTENNQLNQVIGRIIAQRPSSGSTTLMAYSIISGNTGGMFNIDQFGELIAIKVLDFEDRVNYALEIQAMDTLNPSLKTIVPVQVNVLDENDNTPIFTLESNTVQVTEGVPIGYVILKCKALDLDSGKNADITFKMINNTGPFSVTNLTGEIYTLGPLDYETTKMYNIYLQVLDNGEPSLFSEIKLTIIILDMNDNAPVFTNLSFVVYVKENLKVGVPIANITATDADTGTNGMLNYQLLESTDAKSFFLNSDGELYLKEALDREQKNNYDIQVSVHDMGNPPQKAETWVRIIIDDCNDEMPVFEKSSYRFDLYEESSIGTIVGEIVAVDKDEGSNGMITYTLLNKDGNFVISSVYQSQRFICVITSAKIFDSETGKQSYTVTVVATDHGKPANQNQVLIEVHIKNINDHPPRFSQNLPYLTSVTEDTPAEIYVMQIIAKDDDAVPLPLEYSFVVLPGDRPEALDLFELSLLTGNVYTKKKITCLSETVFNITIQVKEVSAGELVLVNYQKLVIIIAPAKPKLVFTKSCLHVHVKETTEPGLGSLGVELYRYTDSSFIISDYSFATRNPNEVLPFNILRKTGIVTLVSRVYYKSYPYNILNITAKGTRNNKIYNDYILLFVYVIPRNYYSPSYPNNPERYEIPENSPPYKIFGTLKLGLDKDEGAQGNCMYSIVETSPADAPLRILPLDRQIMFTKSIDREVIEQFVLKVRITDLALDEMARLSQTFTVYVSVKDLNDNKPVFLSSNYSNIFEDTAVGTVIATVQAKDPDQGETNTQLGYTIISGNHDDMFILDYYSGQLRTQKTINIYARDRYYLDIMAVEIRNGKESQRFLSLNATMKVDIKVIDVNNKIPKFTQSMYRATVLENEPIGTFIIQVNSTDDDIDPINKDVIYKIIDGDDAFTIHPKTGVIRTKTVHDREKNDMFQIVVSVRNIDRTCDYSTSIVNIQVGDVNDFPPEFPGGSRLKLRILENLPPFEFHKFLTIDHDLGSNADVVYSISPNLSEFKLDTQTGRIAVTVQLDREKRDMYNFIVTAQNIEPPFQKTFQNVTIIVDDENDEKPTFERHSYYVEIYEDAPIHINVLLTVKATDKDKGNNAVIAYSIFSSNCPLAIDSNTGDIKLAKPLDYENVSSYLCTVNASGPGINHYDTAKVSITVIDVNDNYPKFSQPVYYVTVHTIQIENPIFTVQATDADENGKQPIQYSIYPAHDFIIQWHNGDIYIKVTTKLPPGHYRAHVTASDLPRGKRKGQNYVYPSKKSEATVLITVGNLTDSTLRFLNESVVLNINESTPLQPLANCSLGFLIAVSTQNAPIEYSITNGSNPEYAFAIRSTGELYVNNSDAVDHEKYAMFFLRILASTSLSSRAESSILLSVLIQLNDLNDNAPMIYPQNATIPYPETIEKNFHPSVVYYFHVRDEDKRDKGKLHVEIFSGNDDGVFGLNLLNVLYIAKPIDYEKKDHYHLVLRATDGGDPFHHAYSDIYINLEDQNDNPPTFVNLNRAKIPENSLTGTIVTTVTATDVDIVTTTIRYGMVQSSEPHDSQLFEIDELLGVIKLTNFRLDYESKKLYTLNISAYDGYFTTYAPLEIYVEDQNDNRPQFTQAVYTVNVSNTLKKNKHIIKVVAHDLDSGIMGYVSYKLDPNHLRDAFTIEQNSGNIFTLKDYTFPADIGYATLSVIAFDNDGKPISHMSRAIVKMYVSGKQSRNPVFMQSVYEMSIEELASRRVPVGQVTATYPTGVHKEMTYSIVKGNIDNAFAIDVFNGFIVVNNDLDRETRDMYALELLAEVVGDEKQKAHCVVKIAILDNNDNAPEFLQDQYGITVSEDVEVGYSLLQVSAVDADEPNTQNSNIKYSIHSGQDKDIWLKIDENTGWVTTNQKLDREVTPKIQLTIVASDGDVFYSRKRGSGHERFVSLNVTLEDVNDNTPIFNLNSPIHDFIVKENQTADTPALKVTAVDLDDGKNGKVSYLIINSTGMGCFHMKDSHTGWVYTSKVLDYEKQNSYNLTILAYDHGTPRREASFEYRILVEDVNEFAPAFNQSSFSFNVLANAEINTIVGKVSATDQDGGPAGKIRFTFQKSNKYFSISETTGFIIVIDDLRTSLQGLRSRRDVDIQPYIFVVLADNGADTLFVSTKVQVLINFTCLGCEPVTTVAPVSLPSSMNASTMIIVLASVAVFVFILMFFCVIVYCRRKGCYLLTKGLYGKGKKTQAGFCASKEKVVGPSLSFERELLHSDASSFDRLHFYTECPKKHDNRLLSETCLIQDSGGTVRSVSATDKASTYSFGIYHEQAVPESEMRQFSDTLSTMSNLEQDSVFAYSTKKTMKPARSCVSRSTQESSLYSLTSNQPNANVLNLQKLKKSTMSSRTGSHESLNDFQEEGGGEAAGGIDVGNLLYAKLSEVDEEEPASMMDGVRSFREEGAPPSRGHSLSTIAGSDVALNYDGPYNANWRSNGAKAPFSEKTSAKSVAKIISSKNNILSTPKSQRTNMTTQQTKPSNDIPLQVLNSGRTSLLSSVHSLPRTPLEIASAYTSGALSPNFTPALTPLVCRSPSVSSVGTSDNFKLACRSHQQPTHALGLNTGFVRSESVSSQLSRITLSDISVSDDEEQRL